MKLHFFDIRSPLPQNWRELITPLRQRRAERFLQSDDRLRCLGAGILLARELGVSSDEELIYGSWGKPSLRNGSAHFNLSHAGNLVVLAVSENPVGVDIEQIRPITYKPDEMAQFLRPEEVSYLKEHEDAGAFYRLWTGKEALMKATGCGLFRTPASICVLPVIDGAHMLDNEIWDMRWLSMDGYIICTAEHKNCCNSNLPI